MYKAIIFDFDGVILESVGVKADAFAKLFMQYPDKLDQIMNYHMENGGVSRYKKFDYIYREILKEGLNPEKSEQLGQQFTDNAYQGVIDSPFVPGALEFLKEYSDKIMLFVASGTPHEEMLKVVEERDLQSFFKGVYGSPSTKGEIATKVLCEFNLQKEEVLFVGDAPTDLDGAREVGIRFIGRVHESYENPFKDLEDKDLIRDLTELKGIIEDKSLV